MKENTETEESQGQKGQRSHVDLFLVQIRISSLMARTQISIAPVRNSVITRKTRVCVRFQGDFPYKIKFSETPERWIAIGPFAAVT